VSELLDLARFALAEAMKAGADSADVSIAQGKSLEVELQESAVASCDRHEGVSANVRCFVKGGCGIHMCHGLERGDLVYAAKAAVGAARAAGPDPDFRALPGPTPAGTVPDLYDEAVAEMSVRDAARGAVDRARRPSRKAR
jgi:predicted Zn-dependent protease